MALQSMPGHHTNAQSTYQTMTKLYIYVYNWHDYIVTRYKCSDHNEELIKYNRNTNKVRIIY